MEPKPLSLDESLHTIASTTRIVLIVVLTAVCTWFFMNFLNQYLLPSKASAKAVNVTFVPNDQLMNTVGVKKITVFVQPTDESKKISGFDLNFKGDNLTILDIGIPKAFPAAGAQPRFNPLVRGANQNNGRAYYVINEKADTLPHAVQLDIFVQPTIKNGTASLSLELDSSVVTGSTDNVAYDFGTVEEGHYTIKQ